MLGMQDDVSDIELKQRWRLYWIETIYEIANIESQKISTSFEELLSSYFDNLSLFNGYEKALQCGNVTQEEAQNVVLFHDLLYIYDEPNENFEDILEDEEWLNVVNAAQEFWNYLKVSVTSKREIDLINILEKKQV